MVLHQHVWSMPLLHQWIWSNLRGDTPAPSHTPAAVGDEEVTYGYVP